MKYPRLRADYVPIIVIEGDDERLFLLNESRRLVVEDPVAAGATHLLDGTRDVGAIVAELDGKYPVGAVVRALRKFEALGVLTEGPAAATAASAGWDALGIDPSAAAAPTAPVPVVELGEATSITVAGVLTHLGLPVRRVEPDELTAAALAAAPSDTPVVVVADSFLDPRLSSLNEAFLTAGGPGWVLARPRGMVPMLGPHLLPGHTGCWACLRQRWTENEQVEAFLARTRPDGPRPSAARAALPGSTTAVAGLLHTELAVIAQRGRSDRLTGRMLALDVRDHTTSSHVLVRQPQCPACGDPDLLRKADPKVVITSRGAGSAARTTPPAAVVDRLSRHVSPYLGVVTHLTAVDAVTADGAAAADDGLMFNYTVGHNLALGRDVAGLRRSLRGQSGGKGHTDAAARASALGEAIERYCGVWRDDRATHRAAFADLGRDQAVPLRELLGFSARQYAERDRLNATAGPFHWIPRPVGDATEISWTTAWSLTEERTIDLPAAYCWYGHPEARGATSGGLEICAADSNGSAAGSTVEEAVVQGFCEVAERDAVALWWYHRSVLPGIDLATFPDPWPETVRRYHADRFARRLWALDLTADLGIPVFAAISARADCEPDTPEDVIIGFGAHLDPATALTRAVSEVNQFLPAISRRTPDGRTRYGLDDPASLHWFGTVRTAEQPWLCPDPDRPPTTAVTHQRMVPAGDLAQDVGACVAVAARAGLDMIAVDQSRPDLDLAVVKVVVPGARHFWRRLGPGRLWDVPPAIGRRPYATTEDEVNPYSIFF